MSDVILVAIIAAIPGTLAAILGIRNGKKLEEVHLSIDGRMDELVIASRNSGKVEEQDAQMVRDEDKGKTGKTGK